MRYFIVFQGKSFAEEFREGYLWAPKLSKDGEEIFHWKNMTKIKKGDIIFSIVNGKLVSVNEAMSDCMESTKPASKNSSNWEENGWLVKAKYNLINNPFKVKEHFDEIKDMLPSRYSPFDKNGDGNQGYLFEIGPKLASYILDLTKDDFANSMKEKVSNSIIETTNSLLDKILDKTEEKTLIKTRIGQGLFKKKLLEISNSCIICGLKTKELLIASHIKPWSRSNNKERLDVNNGFLMCPNHDALFDKGYISFSNEGNILISSAILKEEYAFLNIDENIKISINPEQIKYIEWHRKNVFIKS